MVTIMLNTIGIFSLQNDKKQQNVVSRFFLLIDKSVLKN